MTSEESGGMYRGDFMKGDFDITLATICECQLWRCRRGPLAISLYTQPGVEPAAKSLLIDSGNVDTSWEIENIEGVNTAV